MLSYGIPLPRVSVALGLAAIVTVALFLLMHDLIRMRGEVPDLQPTMRITSIVRLLEDVPIVENTPPEKPPLVETPPPFDKDLPIDRIGDGDFGIGITPPEAAPEKIEFGQGMPDGDMLPIVKVAPNYPRRAADRGIQGYVLLEFTVDETGRVVDPRIIESSPANIFDQSALRAVLRFKYKPRVVNGRPIRVEGVLHRLIYELSGAQA